MIKGSMEVESSLEKLVAEEEVEEEEEDEDEEEDKKGSAIRLKNFEIIEHKKL